MSPAKMVGAFVLLSGFLAAISSTSGQVVNVETEHYPSFGKVKLEIATPLRTPTGGYRAPKAPSWKLLFLSRNLFTTPEGQTGLRARYYDNWEMKGDPAASRVVPFAAYDTDFVKKNLDGESYAASWRGTYGPAPHTGTYLLKTVNTDGVRAWIDGKKVIDDWKAHKARNNAAEVKLKKGETVDVRIEHFFRKKRKAVFKAEWGLSRIRDDEADTDKPAVKTLEFELISEQGETVHREDFEFEYNRAGKSVFIDVGDLEDGHYTVRLGTRNFASRLEEKIVRKHFVWEGNRLGITKQVLPPFTPVRRDSDSVAVVMRCYRQNGLGLWSSVQARGNDAGSEMQEMLAGPIQLRVNDGTVLAGKGRFTGENDQKVVFDGKANHPAVSVETRCTTHYDGVMKVEMSLKPGEEGEQLEKLWLDIPVRDAMAPLFHGAMSGRIRLNPAGKVPAGTGRVWDARDMWAPHFYGNFHPYLWVGAEERGICWFADNDRGWELDVNPSDKKKSVPCQELIRQDDTLLMRVNIIQKPVTLEEPRKIVFGLMATPGKPMPKNWCNVFFRARYPHSRKIHWMAAQYWGSPTVMYSKLPIDQDIAVLSKLQEMRMGGGGWGQFMRAWARLHLGGEPASLRGKNLKTKNLLDHAMRISRHAGDFLTVYWEEHHATTLGHPERTSGVFPDEWMRSTHSYPESYLNFAAWCGAEFIRRGMGLYFDNTFPKPTYDTFTTSAYVLPNGRVQPSANMWRQREYLQRIWVLHQQLAPRETKPLMMLHMTNSHIPPYMVYGMANLDLEWRYGGGPYQKKFPPDLLRAESLGLKSGNIPTSLASHGSSPWKTVFGAMMVHEIRTRLKGEGAELMKHLVEFGYGLPDCRVVNYWDANPPLKISDQKCKWLLLERDEKLMLLLTTWNDKANAVRVNFDTDRLDMSPKWYVNARHKLSPKVSPEFLKTSEGKPGLRAEYYASRRFEKDPLLTRTEPTVDIDLDKDQEAPGLHLKDFAVRWTGRIGPIPETGEYRFELRHSGGARLWIGEDRLTDDLWIGKGEIINSRWGKGGSPRTSSAKIKLEGAKDYAISVELDDSTGNHVCQLRCEKLRMRPHPLKNGRFQIDMPKYGVRLIWLE